MMIAPSLKMLAIGTKEGTKAALPVVGLTWGVLSLDSLSGVIITTISAVGIGLTLVLPRLMPHVESLVNMILTKKYDHREKMRLADEAADSRKRHAELEFKLLADKKLEGTYTKQLEDMLEKMEKADQRAEAATEERRQIKEALEKAESKITDKEHELKRLGEKSDEILRTGREIKKTSKTIAKKVGMPSILVVEDDKLSNDALCKLVSSEGYDCHQAFSVAEAMIKLADKKFREALNFVALDLMLPDGDGMNVLRQVKDYKLTCKVIVMTGMSDREKLREAEESWADMVIPKPVNFPEILAWMQSVKDTAPRPNTEDVPRKEA